MVKNLEKGAIVTCYKCHGEGHKFYKCPQFVKKMDKGAKKKLKPTIKSSLIYCRAYTPGTHARKEEEGLLLEFPCNPTRTHSV
jgi:hypothetical protein